MTKLTDKERFLAACRRLSPTQVRAMRDHEDAVYDPALLSRRFRLPTK